MQVDLSHSEVQIRWELSRVVGKSALPPGVLALKGCVLLGCLQPAQCPSYPADSEPKSLRLGAQLQTILALQREIMHHKKGLNKFPHNFLTNKRKLFMQFESLKHSPKLHTVGGVCDLLPANTAVELQTQLKSSRIISSVRDHSEPHWSNSVFSHMVHFSHWKCISETVTVLSPCCCCCNCFMSIDLFLSLQRLFWNQTRMTRGLRPVISTSCSFMSASGRGFAL